MGPENYRAVGVACYKGRCELPSEEDGCGGMEKLIMGAG